MAETAKSENGRNDLPADVVNTRNIVARFAKYSPLLDGEDAQEFADFQLACINAVRPANAIEEVWVLDFINYTWEAMRLRRIKVALIHSYRKSAVQHLLSDHGGLLLGDDAVAEGWSAGDEESVEHVEQLLETHGLDDDTITAIAFQRCLTELESLDRLIASYDLRRDKAIRELEQRRELLARRARAFADNTREAEFIDLPGAADK